LTGSHPVLIRFLQSFIPLRPRACGKAADTKAAGSSNAVGPESTLNTTTRREVLRVVVRESLLRNGIPASWLSPETLRTVREGRDAGLHLRLLVRRWDPRLLQHAVALERDILMRLHSLDPQAGTWFLGCSWQFALADVSQCPPLPHPGSWTAPPTPVAVAQRDVIETQPGGDVIAGPVIVGQAAGDPRANLQRLLALRDADIRRQARGVDAYAPTCPQSL
jgi:hypothetical protein